jgi:thioester reductase-like protein
LATSHLHSTSNVLVTGATGLIGGEILQRLTRMPLGKLWAMIRPRPDTDLHARLHDRLTRSGDFSEAWFPKRIEAIAGDVSRPGWNLEPDTAAMLRRELDMIVHCAADTSFYRNDSVQDTNVEGVRNLIELARQCDRQPLIVYMSTASNSGKVSHCSVSEDQGCQPTNEHHNEYTRSKAVAETLLRESGLPVLTLRPTIVLSANLPDPIFARSILWFVPLLRKFDCLPVDPEGRLDVVPVSFVADMTVRLLEKANRRWDSYHLSAGEQDALVIGEGNEFLNEYYNRRRPLRLVSASEWDSELERQHISSPIQRRIFFAMSYYLPFLNMNVVWDNRRLREELGEESLAITPVRSYLGRMLEQISAEDALRETAAP